MARRQSRAWRGAATARTPWPLDWASPDRTPSMTAVIGSGVLRNDEQALDHSRVTACSASRLAGRRRGTTSCRTTFLNRTVIGSRQLSDCLHLRIRTLGRFQRARRDEWCLRETIPRSPEGEGKGNDQKEPKSKGKMDYPCSDEGGPTPRVLQVPGIEHWIEDAAVQEEKPDHAGHYIGHDGPPAVRARSRAALRSAPRPPAAHAATRSGSTNATTMVLTTRRRSAAVKRDPRGPAGQEDAATATELPTWRCTPGTEHAQ